MRNAAEARPAATIPRPLGLAAAPGDGAAPAPSARPGAGMGVFTPPAIRLAVAVDMLPEVRDGGALFGRVAVSGGVGVGRASTTARGRNIPSAAPL